MPHSPTGETIKEAKFVQALIENNGNASKAYKQIEPHVADSSARQMGYRTLKNLTTVHSLNINKVLEEIGATPKLVLPEALERAKKSKKPADYLNTVKFLAKLGGWDQRKDILATLSESIDTDVIDIVRLRVKKARKQKPDIIDIKAEDAQVVDIKQDATNREQ